jgi:hypothetical protein
MPGGIRRVEAGRIWAPRVFFHNALEPPRFHDPSVVEVDANGVVTSWAIVSGKFSAPLDLRRFPFDFQILPVRVGAFDDFPGVGAGHVVAPWLFESHDASPPDRDDPSGGRSRLTASPEGFHGL